MYGPKRKKTFRTNTWSHFPCLHVSFILFSHKQRCFVWHSGLVSSLLVIYGSLWAALCPLKLCLHTKSLEQKRKFVYFEVRTVYETGHTEITPACVWCPLSSHLKRKNLRNLSQTSEITSSFSMCFDDCLKLNLLRFCTFLFYIHRLTFSEDLVRDFG